MAESDGSEFGSVTSSQRSFLKHCPFANPNSIPTESSDGEVLETNSAHTEILANPNSPPVIKTPVISISSPTSLYSINSDVYRTPPENPSLSSAPDSQTRIRVSESTPRLNSPSPEPDSPPNSPVRSDSVEHVSSPSSVTADNVRVSGHTGVSRSSSPSSSSSASTISDSESVNHGGDENPVPFKEIIETLVRNNGDKRDEQVSYVNMLKQRGLKFP